MYKNPLRKSKARHIVPEESDARSTTFAGELQRSRVSGTSIYTQSAAASSSSFEVLSLANAVYNGRQSATSLDRLDVIELYFISIVFFFIYCKVTGTCLFK